MSRIALYNYFIEEKFKTYYAKAATCNSCRECIFDSNNLMKEILDEHRRNRLTQYEVMGAVSCFGRGILDNKSGQLLEKFEKGCDGVGIVNDVDGGDDDVPNFFHRTFAEYFAARWLTSHHRDFPDFKTIIFQDEFQTVRYMFDSILADGCPAHLAVLNGDLDELKKCDRAVISCKDKGGRNALHLLSSWGGMFPLLKVEKLADRFVVDYTVNIGTFFFITKIRDMRKYAVNLVYEEMYTYLLGFTELNPYDLDEIVQWDSFQYADAALCLYSFEMLSSKYKVDFYAMKNYSDICIVTYYSVLCDFVNLFNALESIPCMDLQPKDNLLHYAAEANLDILKRILSDGFYQAKINTFFRLNRSHFWLNLSLKNMELFSIKIAEDEREKSFGISILHIAASNGEMDKIRLLLKYEADINISNEYGVTPLHLAVNNGHVEVIKYLLEKGAKSDIADHYGIDLLSLAAYHGRIDVMKLLLATTHLSVNNTFEDTSLKFNVSPLYLAAASGQVEAMKYLIKNGADVNATLQEYDNIRPVPVPQLSVRYSIQCPNSIKIDRTVKLNHCEFDVCGTMNGPTNYPISIEIDRTVKSKYYELDVCGTMNGQDSGQAKHAKNNHTTSLHVAARNGKIDAVKLLVENKANFTNQYMLKYSPVHLASNEGHANVVEYFIEIGGLGPFDEQDFLGQTCLHGTILGGHFNLAEYLIKQGVDVNKKNEFGDTPLVLSVKVDSVRLVEVLLAKNKVINDCCDKDEYKLLQLAATHDSINVFNFLKARNFDITPIITKDRKNLLHLAALSSSYKVASSLINDKIFDINQTDVTGHTSLHYAILGLVLRGEEAYSNGIRLLRLLLENDADVDASKCKMSPLFIAVNDIEYVCVEAVKILISHGADPNFKRTFDGSSPLLACVKHGHGLAVDLLLEAGADINAADNNGDTALHQACLYEDKNIVRQLLNHKQIDPRVRNNRNETPRSLAIWIGNEEIFQMFANSSRN